MDKPPQRARPGSGWGRSSPAALEVDTSNRVGIGITPAATYILNVGPGNVALAGPVAIGRLIDAAYSLAAASGIVTDTNLVAFGKIAAGVAPQSNERVSVRFPKATEFGLAIQPFDADTGVGSPMSFGVRGSSIGSISTTDSATAFNTSSDVRLKHAIEVPDEPLGGGERAPPVRFLWKKNDSQGHGFLAHEVAAVVPGVVTGDKDATHPDGTMDPQQIDYSKLVPWLVGAVKELTQQIEMLQAQLAAASV